MGIDAQMFVRTRSAFTDDEIKALSYRLAQAVGSRHFMHSRTWEEPHHYGCLQRIDSYQQDGDDIVPEPGETFIEVHLFGRYYGPEYERGDPWVYIAVAEFLERNIPDCSVWYGGYSSSVCASPFGLKEREELIRHWALNGHDPYTRYGTMTKEAAPDGSFPRSKVYGVPMIRNGWGPDYAAFYCPASGEKQVWRGGKWLDEKEIAATERW